MSGTAGIMGILNVTPDSFSDGGRFQSMDAVLARVQQMLEQGMDVLDIGAESTRPGASAVSAEEEWARLHPVIRQVRAEWPSLTISVDTFKPAIARQALALGVNWINDVWGGRRADFFPEEESSLSMVEVAAEMGCPIVLMHNRLTPDYADFWSEFSQDIDRMLERAEEAGISGQQIWLDPGFGFGKAPQHNLEVLKHLERLVERGYPVLLGTSRKSTIGRVLQREVEDRGWGTAATLAWGVAKGCRMVRVHDIREMRDVVRMTEAIQDGLQWKET